ncbi:hypothetical protein P4E94_19355 [Pontiellaceae bacterium B12219]|nr:hypothetical protein [Pontiellaceae bacterium B12219]
MNVEMSESEKQEYQKKKNKGIMIGALCGVMLLLFIFPWGLESGIERKVIDDSIRQFNIAMRTENYMDAYVQAGIITAAHLQAEDEVGYLKWKEVEKKLERKLGMNY